MTDPQPFDPVPARARKDGWTPERQYAFIAALAECGRVAKAARAVGMTRETAYRLRARAGAESFAAAWDAALRRHPRQGTSYDLLYHRALYGIVNRIRLADGSIVTHTRPDNAALLRLMRRADASARRSESHSERKARFKQTL